PAVVRLRGHVDDLIKSAADEVHELELGHGAQSRKSGAEGSADDGRLRNRRINHTRGAEAVDEAVGDFEGAAVDADVLTQAKDTRVALHLLPDSLADGFEVGDDGHEQKCSKRRRQRSVAEDRCRRTHGPVLRSLYNTLAWNSANGNADKNGVEQCPSPLTGRRRMRRGGAAAASFSFSPSLPASSSAAGPHCRITWTRSGSGRSATGACSGKH